MSNSLLLLLLIVLVALALLGRCDVRRAAGQVPHVTQARQLQTAADPPRPPGGKSASVHPTGPWNQQEGGVDHGLETDPLPDRR
jgi:hypothetical protein